MSKGKRNLLISAIFVILFIPFQYFILNNLMIEMYEKMGKTIDTSDSDIISYIVVYGIYLIGAVYFLILSLNKKIDLSNHRVGIIIWSIIYVIWNMISGIFGFMALSDTSKVKKEKRELPVIEEKEFTNKWLCLAAFILCMIIMFVISDHAKGLTGLLIVYGSILAIMLAVFFKQLKHDFKIFKEYFKEYMSLTFKTWLKSLLILMIISISIQLITNLGTSNNQASLQEMFNKYPIVIALLAMFYAPFAEELMFRGVFRKFIKSKYLFIIISGVMFGLLHVIDDSKTLAEFSYIIVYTGLGVYMASIYYKTNNLFSNITFHFFQNTLGVIGMILLHFLG